MRTGLAYGIAAYGFWGLVPIYFSALKSVPALELLAQRVIWTLVFVLVVLGGVARLGRFRSTLASRKLMWRLALSTLFIAANWFVFIYAVITDRVVETSLGYFIGPLVSVLLGVLVFGEALRPLQRLAIALAALGIGCRLLLEGYLPWIALTLACTFSIYGMIRKTVPVDGLVSLAIESLLVTPLAIAYLLYLYIDDRLGLGSYGWGTDVLLILSGIVTAIPLICFGQAARFLPLSTMGFLQYLSPSLSFLIAVTLLGDTVDSVKLGCFVLIWLGVACFLADTYRSTRRPKPVVPMPLASLPTR